MTTFYKPFYSPSQRQRSIARSVTYSLDSWANDRVGRFLQKESSISTETIVSWNRHDSALCFLLGARVCSCMLIQGTTITLRRTIPEYDFEYCYPKKRKWAETTIKSKQSERKREREEKRARATKDNSERTTYLIPSLNYWFRHCFPPSNGSSITLSILSPSPFNRVSAGSSPPAVSSLACFFSASPSVVET